VLGSVLFYAIAFTVGLIIPFVAAAAVPAQHLMPAPALADFDETRSLRVDPGLAPALSR
jgi:hypothetical protein